MTDNKKNDFEEALKKAMEESEKNDNEDSDISVKDLLGDDGEDWFYFEDSTTSNDDDDKK